MKRSIEKLSHFQCESCDKWFAIGDAPENRLEWTCPWCGIKSNDAKVDEGFPSMPFFTEENSKEWYKKAEDFLKKNIESCRTELQKNAEILKKNVEALAKMLQK